MEYLKVLIEASSDKTTIMTDIECIRKAIIAEYDAVNMYENFAKNCKNQIVKKIFQDIANEEKIHIGEFEELANSLDPIFLKSKLDGEKEVKDIK